MHQISKEYILDTIRTVPNWPVEGVMFRDITPLFQDSKALRGIMDTLIQRYIDKEVDVFAGLDARGFLLGVTMSYALNKPFVPIRKKGKLPYETIEEEYTLEYAKETVEIHKDACKPGDRVVLIDDLIATGGTMKAGANLIEKLGGKVMEAAAIIDLPDLGGSKVLKDSGIPVFTICEFEGD